MTTPAPSAGSAVTAALTATADAENAAIYGYALAAPHLGSAAERMSARGDYDIHRAQLQVVTGWLAESGATPPAPAAVYALPHPVIGPSSASALLAALEEGAAARYADLVAASTGSLRRAAALALQAAAVREAHWKGRSVPFPGLVDRLPGSTPSGSGSG